MRKKRIRRPYKTRKVRKPYRRIKKTIKVSRGRKPYNKIEDIEDFYKAINLTQSTNKPVYIISENHALCLTIENILKDAEIEYTRKKKNKRFIYRLISKRNIHEEIDKNTDKMDDEIFSLEDEETGL